MNTLRKFDIAIIGGGIVGSAVAMTLASRCRASVVVVEKEETLAAHQTGHNSGVIHSGLYYRPGSLKAKNCTEGRRALYRFCQEEGVAHEPCGKIVVATREEELGPLETLEKRGRKNGLQGLARIESEEIREIEPHIRGIAGLRVPETGIVDFIGVTEAYGRRVVKEGGEILLGTELLSCKRLRDELILETTRGEIHASHLINCAGLACDRVARLCGVEPGLRIVPFRGEYYEIVPDRQHLVKHLVYPVPDPQYPFLGVHFTRMVKGGVEAGPNAVLALKREGYRWRDISLKDIASYLFYPGFWKMALRYWKTGFVEVYRSLSKRAFVKALRRLMPELEMADVRRTGSGVRAQALEPSGQLADDFRIVEAERMIHVLNAPSPAATASIAIGTSVAQKAVERFKLKLK
jgi:L-2-hydroxyglutarate oxidase